MSPEQNRQGDTIFQAALDLKADEREAYLDRACAGDEGLRREVESLLNAYERAGSFMDHPAVEVDAALVAGQQAASLVGQTIQHYRVVRLLGAGGMGEVYLATDTKLGRSVALKLLPAFFTNDVVRLRRFQQEARSASALNHPHIAHIYEIGQADGYHFITMEYVEGETLREKIHGEKAALKRLLEWLTQIAHGLAKAHAAGIVHRDLKPDNIMISRDGYAKILDFGLVKLVEATETQTTEEGSGEATTALLPQQNSLPGMVLGTAGYMSPEQAQGRVNEIDQRSDIFSFGCILFEAVTGRQAFEGKDTLDSLHKIVHEPSPSIKDINPAAPDELQKLIRRCLMKDPDKRYQSIKDVAIELEELGQELAGWEHLSQPRPSGEASTGSIASAQRTSAQRSPTSTTESIGPQQSVTSAGYLATKLKGHRLVAILMLLGLVIAGVGYGIYRLVIQRKAAPSFQAMKIVRLTTSGRAADAAISPDGKYVAYINLDEGGRQSIWLRQVATSSNVKIVDSGQMGFIGLPRGLTFSPDGDYLYYRARTEVPTGRTNVYALFRIPVLGGDSRKVIGSIYSPVSFSPDGKRLAFVRNNQPVVGESYLIVANADGTDERIISTHKLSEAFAYPNWPMSPAWSPDGKALVCASGMYPSSLIEVQTDSGAERTIGPQRWAYIDHLSWLSDGSALILTVQEESSAHLQIWEVSYPSGEARRITNDLNSYRGMSLTADSSTMAVVQTVTQSDIWIMPNSKMGEARRITSGAGSDNGYHGLSGTPDGKLIYASSATGNLELWSIDANGGNQKQLTSDAHQYDEPMVTPDGRYVAFYSNRTGPLNLWRMDADGGNLKPLTTGKLISSSASCSPDGKLIVYSSTGRQGTPVLWRIGIDGGEPVQLNDDKYWAELPSISPDGKQIVFQYFGEGQPAALGSIPIEGGQITQIAKLPRRIFHQLRWTPDGSAIAYIDDRVGTQNIWAIPVGGGAPKQLTDFNTDQNFTFSFDWSRDGKQLALARGTQISDVLLISNLK